MKYLDFYRRKGIQEDGVFDYLTTTMRPSISGWNYFVDWVKVKREATKYTDELNLLNGLIGSTNLKQDFLEKVQKYPSIILAFPTLLAVRDRVFQIFETDKKKAFETPFVFEPDTEMLDPEDYWVFFKNSGLADLVEHKRIKNLTDYVFGVEVGLDSNGRKNRGGHAMEELTETYIKSFCAAHHFTYLKEANAQKIKNEFGIDVPVDKSSRRYDFVVNTGFDVIIFETNFYGGGGSKLKSTAGEYRNLFDVLEGRFKFVWVTDGGGWRKTQRPLRETFDHNDFVFNLSMLEGGILDSI